MLMVISGIVITPLAFATKTTLCRGQFHFALSSAGAASCTDVIIRESG
jgi:hypothetical protein